jgi:predicted transcriptional regulator
MRAPRDGEATGSGPELEAKTKVKDAVPVLAQTESAVRVVEDGRVVGIVDRETILRAMTERPEVPRDGS